MCHELSSADQSTHEGWNTNKSLFCTSSWIPPPGARSRRPLFISLLLQVVWVCVVGVFLGRESKKMTAATKDSLHSQMEHLQMKYVGTGHADTSKLYVYFLCAQYLCVELLRSFSPSPLPLSGAHSVLLLSASGSPIFIETLLPHILGTRRCCPILAWR